MWAVAWTVHAHLYPPHDHFFKRKSVFVKSQTGLIKLETEIETVYGINYVSKVKLKLIVITNAY